jgi:hypothetical protein
MDMDESISFMQRAETTLEAARKNGKNAIFFHNGEQCEAVASALATAE